MPGEELICALYTSLNPSIEMYECEATVRFYHNFFFFFEKNNQMVKTKLTRTRPRKTVQLTHRRRGDRALTMLRLEALKTQSLKRLNWNKRVVKLELCFESDSMFFRPQNLRVYLKWYIYSTRQFVNVYT